MHSPIVNRKMLSIVLASAGIIFPQALMAQGYFMLIGGNHGALNSGSFGIEAGTFFPRKDPRFFLGGDFSTIGKGYLDYLRGPNGTRIPDENEFGAVAGIRMLRGVYLVGTAGVSWHSEQEFLPPNGGSLWFGEGTLIGEKRKVYGSGSGQLRFVFKRMILGAGYHSRRGVVVGVGFTFSGLAPGRKNTPRN